MNTITIYNTVAMENLHVELYDDGILQVSDCDSRVIAETSLPDGSTREELLVHARTALRDMLDKLGDVLLIDEVSG